MATHPRTSAGESPSGANRLIAPLLVCVGAALVIASIVTGSARLYLLLFIPVIAGDSLLLVLGAVLIVLGIAFLPMAWVGGSRGETLVAVAPSGSEDASSASFASGGLILVGPVPIFWGAWKGAPRWAYGVSAVAGGLVVLLLVLYFVGRL